MDALAPRRRASGPWFLAVAAMAVFGGYAAVSPSCSARAALAAGAWQPPPGVPVPPFGMTESARPRPDPWTSPVAGFYYVDATASNATDNGNPFGTPDRPRGTIPTSLPAGAVVELRGRYETPHRSPATIEALGTTASPVFIRGVSATARPQVRRGWEVRGSYLILENLDFGPMPDQSDTGSLVIRLPASHVVLRHSEVHGTRAGGGVGIVNWETPYGVRYTGTGTIDHVVLYDNFIHDNGDVKANYDQDVHGISVSDHVHHVWIVDNEIARNSGDGLQINAQAGQGQTTHHIYVGRNASHHNKQSGFWVKQATDVIFSQNVAYGHRPSNSSLGQCMGAQYAPDWLWFLFNTIADCEYGIAQMSDNGEPSHTFVIGNVIHNVHKTVSSSKPESAWGPAGVMFAGGDQRRVVGNTLYDVDAGVNSPSTVGTIELVNNIIGNLTLPGASHVNLEMTSLASRGTLHHTLFGGDPRVAWGGPQTKLVPALLKKLLSTSSDPRFVDAARGDFHIGATSPAAGAGVASSVYATFQQRYGIGIAVDRDGRPLGTRVDIGAYAVR